MPVLLIFACWIVWILGDFFFRSVAGMPRWELFADEILQLNPAGEQRVPEIPSGLAFLSQRVPIWGSALVLLLAAAAHGLAVLLILGRDVRWMLSERLVIVLGTGFSLLSLVTLMCGLFGQLSLAALIAPSFISLLVSGMIWRTRSGRQTVPNSVPPTAPSREGSVWIPFLVLAVVIPYSGWLLLGAVTPPTDFDVREYHLQGPKEWFQQGQITFLGHNVYTSFPFQSEMLSLAGMVITGDWWRGALTGQAILAVYQLGSVLCVYAISRRWICRDAAWLSVLMYLTTPWTLRISVNPLAEGSLTFSFTALGMVLLRLLSGDRRQRQLIALSGLLAGSAMASKYTGLITAVVPGAFLVGWHLIRDPESKPVAKVIPDVVQYLAIYSLAVLCIMGPWLLRNVADTRNPVYPLAYSVFGGHEWTPEMEARWKPAHAPADHRLADIITVHFLDVATKNTWTSGLLFALCVPGIRALRRTLPNTVIFGLIAWNFLTWWALTHRIDRFWIPGIPFLSIAAGVAWTLSSDFWWRLLTSGAIVLATIFNVWFGTTALVGFHAGLMDLEAARDMVIRADIRLLNETLPSEARVLMVGEAEVFDADFSLMYNTVFDSSLFREFTADPDDHESGRFQKMDHPDHIRERLEEQHVTHVYVHWGEVLRYRQPGSYGYEEYVQPSRFTELVRTGVLESPQVLLERSWKELPEADRKVVASWDGAEQLIRGETWTSGLLYPVKDVPTHSGSP